VPSSKKQSSGYQKWFNCSKRSHLKKKKGKSEKASAAAGTSIEKTRTKCSHCGRTNHSESNCWKKYPHKAPRKSSMEASEAFLEEELLVCKIEAYNTYIITENIEDAYYYVPITDES
jgi:hypothetical protein